jgi:dipeptidyl aminopeptidase/acylaminoacyl peptidase
MQGSEDRVVPPAQSELIVEAIEKRGGDVKYVLFEGEGHGFRRAENLRKALDEELAFYERVLKLKT